MSNYIVVTPLFKQRVNEQGGPEDTIVLSAPEGVIVKLDDIKHKEIYSPYLLGEKEMADELVEKTNSRIMKKRRHLFKKEADDLYMEWQFDLATNVEAAGDKKLKWEKKVAEIKANYPMLTLN